MRNKDIRLLQEAYNTVRLSHYKTVGTDRDFVDYIASLDGIEVEPDYEDEQGNYTSATASIDTTTFPKTHKMLEDLVKQGKLKPMGGPVTKDMTGRARPVALP